MTAAISSARLRPEMKSWSTIVNQAVFETALSFEVRAELLTLRADPAPGEPYGRRCLHRDELGEVMLAGWGEIECAPTITPKEKEWCTYSRAPSPRPIGCGGMAASGAAASADGLRATPSRSQPARFTR
jgi:hypothetical protein